MVEGFDPEFAAPGEWARLYRACAVQIVPACAHGEVKPGASWKRPLMRSWVEYQEALVPQETFDGWYGSSGQYVGRPNMGAICGRASGGLFVIDLDTHKTALAEQWWDGLIAVHNNNMELETPIQRTGGGGLQMLFRAPPGWTPPTCKTSIGVDIRGQGGFAMFAPSMHESGRAYEWFDGKSPDDVEIAVAPGWLVEAITELVAEHGGGSAANGSAHTASREGTKPDATAAYDGFGHQTDGREDKMYRMVWRVVVKWYRQCPIKPSDAESAARCAAEYDIYERGVKPQGVRLNTANKADALDAEGRGPREWGSKWRHAMKQWEGKVRAEASKPDPHPDDDRPKPGGYTDYTDEFAKAQSTPGAQPAGIYELLSVKDIKSMADPLWLVDGLVVDQSMGFIYGPPGCLKTFLALGMALSLASGQKLWWDRGVQRAGAVVYISSEGQADLKFRIMAWERHHKVAVDDCPFFLIRQSINFMDGADVMKLLATVQTVAAVTPIAAVFVDTVSRVLPGAEENLQKDMSLFVAACDAVRQTFLCTVFGLHHTNKNGGMRGSTVMPGAGDFIIEMLREPAAMNGSIRAAKIKAAEDGWEQAFEVKKIDLPGIVPHSSLVLVPVQAQPQAARAAAGTGGLPDISVCREILSAIALAWVNKAPWHSGDNSQRPAIRLIMARWNLKRDVVRRLIDGWMANGIIEHTMQDTTTKVSGYRKIIDL